MILVRSTDEIVSVLRDLSDQECYEIGARARERFLRNHSARRYKQPPYSRIKSRLHLEVKKK
jgi:hypothetical protein